MANNIDRQNKESGEFAPFLNIMSEWYLRDSSRKVKASHRARGMSGRRLTFTPIYGYKLDPSDKNKWIIDHFHRGLRKQQDEVDRLMDG